MNTDESAHQPTQVTRRKHIALAAECSYRAVLGRYCEHLNELPFHLPSAQKPERSPTALVKNCVLPDTQNQALNATVFPSQILRACFKNRPVRGPGLQWDQNRRVSCRPRALTRRFRGFLKQALSEGKG